MNVFEMVIIVSVFAIGAGVVNNWLKAQNRIDTKNVDEQIDNTRLRRIEELEQRIQVLERIVTDRGYDLKERINKL